MSWFKVDDGFYSSRKVVRIPRARRYSAVGLWLIAGTWCADHLTDGRIEAHELEELGGRVADARALVECQLWESVGGAYQFHNWSKYQPTREQVLGQREAEAERKRKYRENTGKQGHRPGNVRAESQRDNSGVPLGHQAESGHPDPTRPDPTRPVPKGTSGKGAATRGSRLPADWMPSELLLEWARTKAPSVTVATETENFRDYWTAKAGAGATKLDWAATWRTWMRRTHERNLERGWVPQADTDPGQEWMRR